MENPDIDINVEINTDLFIIDEDDSIEDILNYIEIFIEESID